MSFKGLASSQGQIITYRLIQVHTTQTNTLQTNPYPSESMQFQQEINKMLQAGVLVLVHEATPWINSFVLVESKDKLGNLKLCTYAWIQPI